MTRFRAWRHFDYVLLVVTILLIAYGVVMIHSTTQGSLDPDVLGLWRRQAIVGVAGVGLVILLAAFPHDYQWLGDFWWLAYLLAVVLLVLAYFFGSSEIGEVRGWLKVGTFNFQPSLLAMDLLTISIGSILSRRRRHSPPTTPLFGTPKTSLVKVAADRPDFLSYLLSVLMTLSLAALVFLQPDMATAAVFIAMWLAMLFGSDVQIRYLMFTALVGLILLVPLWGLMEDYQRDRVLGLFNPEPGSHVEYQIKQSLIAIGSGGLWGKGLGQGTQSQLRYLPTRHTDFIFAVTAEELGFVGVMVLFALYLVLFLRLLRIILIARDGFGRLLVTGTLAMILFQLVVNVGMNMKLLPIAGLPLPFITYGSTSLLTTMIGIGIAENVAMRHRKLEF